MKVENLISKLIFSSHPPFPQKKFPQTKKNLKHFYYISGSKNTVQNKVFSTKCLKK
jgi:hypothetical protein